MKDIDHDDRYKKDTKQKLNEGQKKQEGFEEFNFNPTEIGQRKQVTCLFKMEHVFNLRKLDPL